MVRKRKKKKLILWDQKCDDVTYKRDFATKFLVNFFLYILLYIYVCMCDHHCQNLYLAILSKLWGKCNLKRETLA